LSINGKRKGITIQDLLAVGASIRCKKSSEIIDEVIDIVHQWKRYADAVQVNPPLRDGIDKTFMKV